MRYRMTVYRIKNGKIVGVQFSRYMSLENIKHKTELFSHKKNKFKIVVDIFGEE